MKKRIKDSWKYHRLRGASKWVRGNSWVCKFDDKQFCACGYNGSPLHAWMVSDPKAARKHIDELLGPNAASQTAAPQTAEPKS